MQYWMQCIARTLVACAVVTGSTVLAHGGGLDARGGHTDRKTGTYHCHRATCTISGETPSITPANRGYVRDDWSHWLDDDGDCMNTRHEILLAQSRGNVTTSQDGCRILSGVWFGPYTGQYYTNPSDLDVDHVIPLAWAHAQGAANWPADKKARFANDPVNLLAVDDGLNQSKGAQGPSEWLPPDPAFVCDYLFRWVTVMSAYPELSFSDHESRQVSIGLAQCR